MQTAPCYVPSFWHNTGVWQWDRRTGGLTDGQTVRQTDGIAVAGTALAMRALRRAVKRLRSRIISHVITNVQSVADCGSWQVKLFDTSLISQVKFNVTTANSSCFLPYPRYQASSSSCSRTVPRRTARENNISFLAYNVAKCWLILKFFYRRLSRKFAVKCSLKIPQYIKSL